MSRHMKSSLTVKILNSLVTLLFLLSCSVAFSATNCSPLPSGIVSWWRGEGNANDSVGGNNAIFTNPAFIAGEVNQAFAYTGSNYVRVPASPSVDVGTANGFTIE